jgi:hypothetical protein
MAVVGSSPRQPLSSYADPAAGTPVFHLRAQPQFSPLDVNVAFLSETGWNQSVDRLRFHIQHSFGESSSHPLAELVGRTKPHLLLRHMDREQDCFACIQANVDGDVVVFSNDEHFAHAFFQGVFLECPPSFHTAEEFDITQEWLTDPQTRALFAGMVAGAQGWDPSHNLPDNIKQSLDESRRSLEIANYRSCVVMSRRTLEAVLKLGYERLLNRKPINSKGRTMMLNDMIQEFRNQRPPLIPEHLLHVADSIRVLGNVPGAHSADIPNYHFSRSDAEFALYSTSHFLDQYFSKIDTEVTQYYTVTIDLTEPPNESEPSKV